MLIRLSSFRKKDEKRHQKKVFAVRKIEAVQIYSMLFLLKTLNPIYRVHLHIDILDEYQHMGIGSALLRKLSDYLFEKGIAYMSVCGISNKSDGYNFYKKFGFKKIKDYGKSRLSMTYKTQKEEK